MPRPDDTAIYLAIGVLILIASAAFAGVLWLGDFLEELDAHEHFERLAEDLKDRIDGK
jgi:hypothetical protein